MTRKILAVASAGGHWQQLMELRPAWSDLGPDAVLYVTTLADLPAQFGAAPAAIIPDCNRNSPMAILRSGWRLWRLMSAERPEVVISTGALPGVLALAIGRAYGARTVWLDSVANAEEMSMSGRLARRFADLWLSQWPEVARAQGATYIGSIL
jgi:UDP-N-acetylglucosamine:LPS N-acetylglucosamine transferase